MFFLAIFIILGGLLVGTSLMEFIKDESRSLRRCSDILNHGSNQS